MRLLASCETVGAAGIDPIGRRIYIHEYSFQALARTSEAAARLVFSTLATVIVDKIAYHHLDQANDLGIVSHNCGDHLCEAMGRAADDDLSTALQQIVFRPAGPAERHGAYPLLLKHEQIVATCFEAGYYTFATGKQAADEMYAETGSLRAERAQLRAGHGPDDLTLIKGDSLALLRYGVPTGPHAALAYFSGASKGTRLPPGSLVHVKNEIVREVLKNLNGSIRHVCRVSSANERTVLDQVASACANVLSSGLFADSTLDPDAPSAPRASSPSAQQAVGAGRHRTIRSLS
jgi:hypothetical protein